MTDPYAALRQCVEALELHNEYPGSIWPFQVKATRNAALTAARATLDARQVTPMSQPNRKIAYAASDTLRKLGYQWDEAAEAWRLAAAPPAPQTQRPIRLTDEQIAQCIVEARVNGPFARAGTTSFRIARAVEAEVLRLNGIGGDDE